MRLNSLGNGLLLLKLASLTFRGSPRTANGNSILFIRSAVISQKKQKQSSMQQLPFEPAVLVSAGGRSVGLGGDLRLLTIVASEGKELKEQNQGKSGIKGPS